MANNPSAHENDSRNAMTGFMSSSKRQVVVTKKLTSEYYEGFSFSDVSPVFNETQYCREIRIMGCGNLRYKDKQGFEHTISVYDGDTLPFEVNFIFDTGTDVTGVILIF
jgi:hypothetical protein